MQKMGLFNEAKNGVVKKRKRSFFCIYQKKLVLLQANLYNYAIL